MFYIFIANIVFVFTLSKIEIFANPLELPKQNLSVLPNEVYSDRPLLANQGFEAKNNLNSADVRKKRFLDDIIKLLSLLEDYYDNEEDNASDEKEESLDEEVGSKEQEPCRNYTVIFNKANQALEIRHEKQPSKPQSIHTTLRKQAEVGEKPTPTNRIDVLAPIEKSNEVKAKFTTNDDIKSSVPKGSDSNKPLVAIGVSAVTESMNAAKDAQSIAGLLPQ